MQGLFDQYYEYAKIDYFWLVSSDDRNNIVI